MGTRYAGTDLAKANLVSGTESIQFDGACSNIIMQDVSIPSSTGIGINFVADNGTSYTDIEFTRVTITSPVRHGMRWRCVDASAVSTLTNITIDECTIIWPANYGIRFEAEPGTSASSIMTNIVITDSTVTYPLFGGCRLHQEQDGRNLTVTRNVFEYAYGDGASGLDVRKWHPNPSATFGYITISDNIISNNSDGGFSAEHTDYARVFSNTCDNNGRIDTTGAGIEAANGSSNWEIYGNQCSGNVADDSQKYIGGGIYVTGDGFDIWNNIGSGNRVGIVLGTVTNTAISHNTFANCVWVGFRVKDSTGAAVWRNNIFTGEANAPYGVYDEDENGLSDENYNVFYGFDTDTFGHTLGSNSITSIDPKLGPIMKPANQRLIKAGATTAGIRKDRCGSLFKTPPSPGAYQLRALGGSSRAASYPRHVIIGGRAKLAESIEDEWQMVLDYLAANQPKAAKAQSAAKAVKKAPAPKLASDSFTTANPPVSSAKAASTKVAESSRVSSRRARFVGEGGMIRRNK